MKITIGEVRKYMDNKGASPETVSQMIPISNMTIRRLLRKSDSELIPEKYLVHFRNLLNQPQYEFTDANTTLNILDIESVADHMVKLSKESKPSENLSEEIESKLKHEKFDHSFLENIKALKNFAFQKENIKMSLIALGALIYFINPFDLIPDQIIALGYVDDLGVITMSLTKLRSLKF